VFAAHGGYASAAAFTSGFGPAMGACAGLALVGAIAGLVIPRRPKPAAAPPEPGARIVDRCVHPDVDNDPLFSASRRPPG
jgi:hypothetical protein